MYAKRLGDNELPVMRGAGFDIDLMSGRGL